MDKKVQKGCRGKRAGQKVLVRDKESLLRCYIYSITSHHIVLRLPDGRLWCLTISDFESREES